MKSLLKKKIPLWTHFFSALVAAVAALAVEALCGHIFLQKEDAQADSWEVRYAEATKDAMTIEDEEILPVLTVTKDEPLMTWNEEGRVLLVSLQEDSGGYRAGEETVIKDGDVWAASLGELENWFKNNYDGGREEDDWRGRFEALNGLPAEGIYNYYWAFWVSPEDITRPAYNRDAADGEVMTTFTDMKNVDEDYKKWFDSNIIWSYFDSQYPWTRLGYTYDYMAEDTEYGVSEFLINDGAKVDVEFVYTIEEMVEYLQAQSEAD